jgi:NAD(P)-dependent dehydrogenase (short-subunit alcohol dehydrogenase family)
MSRKILITGGSSGIGLAMVEKFSNHGDEVWFTYFSNDEKPDQVEKKFSGVKAFHLNLGDYSSVTQLVDQLPDTPDVIVHNAGLGSATVAKVSNIAHEQDEALLKVNAVGTLWLNDLLLPSMKKRGDGKIIFLSSVGGGITQIPGFRYADGMSKAAIAFLGKALAADLAESQISVFTICPGATNTPMFHASTLEGLSNADRQSLIASLPKGRLIEPTEIAELAYFLTTDAAKALHGAVLDASMGLGVNPGLLKK